MNPLDRPYPLSPAQIAQFRRDGFIKLKEVLDADTLQQIAEQIRSKGKARAQLQASIVQDGRPAVTLTARYAVWQATE